MPEYNHHHTHEWDYARAACSACELTGRDKAVERPCPVYVVNVIAEEAKGRERATGLQAADPTDPPRVSPPPVRDTFPAEVVQPVRWSYRTIMSPVESVPLEKKLNELGAQGWEVVSVDWGPGIGGSRAGVAVVLLKRVCGLVPLEEVI